MEAERPADRRENVIRPERLLKPVEANLLPVKDVFLALAQQQPEAPTLRQSIVSPKSLLISTLTTITNA